MSMALIIWKALMCLTGSESPVVVVLSGSMEPAFKRVKNPMFFFLVRIRYAYGQHVVFLTFSCLGLQGDILFLHMSEAPFRAGEIVVYNVEVCSFFNLFVFLLIDLVIIEFLCSYI